MNFVDLYPKKVPFMLIDDIDVVAFSTPEYDNFVKNQENSKNVIIEVADGEEQENYEG